MNLYFLHNYNNYFNRIVKPFVNVYTLQDFEAGGYHTGEAVYITGVQFNFADHIETTQIVNWTESWSPDYMLLITDSGVIESTWFVMDSYYTRNGQFNVVLRRDVVNDHYEDVVNAPCFVEKATINDPLNPLLYNSEGMQFNQIKTEEHQLFDETGCGWIVGYVAKPEENEEDVDLNASVNLNFDYTANSLPFTKNESVYFNPTTAVYVAVAMGESTGTFSKTTTNRIYSFGGTQLENASGYGYGGGQEDIPPYTKIPTNESEFDTAFLNNAGSLKEAILATIPKSIDASFYNGKIVYDTEEDKYYRVKPVVKDKLKYALSFNQGESSAIAVALKYAIDQATTHSGAGYNLGYLIVDLDVYEMQFVELPGANLTSKISAGRLGLVDAPYDIFAIPYGKVQASLTGTSVNILTNAEAALNIARDITDKLGTKLYDMQLLPYCPCKEYFDINTFMLDTLDVGIHYDLVSTTSAVQSIIFWCNTSSGTFTIPFNHTVADAKVENETEMWRIVSPNYQGMFEFNAAKNGGINNFVVDYTYKPYNPYIHVAPVWGNLYGSNFGDARGLICGGDFSLPQVSDAFTQYEINNKNYQNIFDRSIQNLDVNRKYQRINDYVGAVAGSVQSSAAGFMLGGGWGAAAGGIAGLGAGLADAAINESLYKEAKDYQTDLYNYNLGNVKAMPDSLTKSSALTINNKTVPILERYSATELEKKMLKNKLQFNGMTVMAIGQLKDYLLPEQTYVQGQLIRIENAEDNHVATALYNEVLKGIFTIYKSEDDN